MKIILPFNTNPPVQTFSQTGYILGVLKAIGYDYSGVLANHYMTIGFNKGEVWMKNYDYVHLNCFDRQRINIPKDNTINFLKQQINNDYYIFLILNERYIKNERAFQHHDFYHEFLVIGYPRLSCWSN